MSTPAFAPVKQAVPVSGWGVRWGGRIPPTRVVRRGSPFALVRRHRLNAGLTYRPWPWLTVSVDAPYVGLQFLRGDEANLPPPLPAYWVLNGGLAAGWRGFEAFVRINNRYETFGTFAPNARMPGARVERFLSPAPRSMSWLASGTRSSAAVIWRGSGGVL